MTSKPTRLERTIDLLWRSKDARVSARPPGPRPRLDVDRIVAAAIAQADEDPVAGASMRAVARRLDVTPMTLYGYVPDKHTLVALMYDAIHAEMAQEVCDGNWRERVVRWATDLVEVYLRHPWAIPVAYGRPVLGPHEQKVVEDVAEILHKAGIEAGTARGMVGSALHLVRGTALAISEARLAVDESGVAEDEWWQAASTRLSEVVPHFGERFPSTVWLIGGSERDGEHPEDGFVAGQSMANLRAGLGLLLEGVDPSLD